MCARRVLMNTAVVFFKSIAEDVASRARAQSALVIFKCKPGFKYYLFQLARK